MKRGLSLIEVVVSLGILALVVGSVLLVYVGLMAGTRKADVRMAAVSALSTVTDLWKIRLKESWPETHPADDVTVVYSGQIREFLYEVEDLGRQPNPAPVPGWDSDDPRRYLSLKRARVTLQYEDTSVSPTVTRQLRVVFHVGH